MILRVFNQKEPNGFFFFSEGLFSLKDQPDSAEKEFVLSFGVRNT